MAAPSVSIKGAFAAAPNFATTSGTATYVNAGGRISLRAAVTSSDVLPDTIVCEYADGVEVSCAQPDPAIPAPYSLSFRLDTIAGTLGFQLQPGSVIEMRLATDVPLAFAGATIASAVLQ